MWSRVCLLQDPQGPQVTWAGREGSNLHEAPPPPHGVRGMQRPRTPPPAQEAKEVMSWEGPHHGLYSASALAPHLRSRSEAGTLHPLGHLQAESQGPCLHNNPCLSLVAFSGRCLDCGPEAVTASVSRRDGHPHLWTELWVSHYLQRTQLVPGDPRPGSQKCYLQHKHPPHWSP